MKKDVIGFGALNVDLIYELQDFYQLHQIRTDIRKGEEYSISSKEYNLLVRLLKKYGKFIVKSSGGQAANSISALTKIGFNTGLVGTVGSDNLGKFLIQELKGTDISGIVTKGETGICIVILDESKDRTMFVLPNANDHIDINEINHSFIANTKFLHLTSFVGERPLLIQKKIMTEIPKSVKVSFDPGIIYSKRGISDLLEIVQRTFVIFLSKIELEYLFDSDVHTASKKLLQIGPKIIVCKMGEQGSIVITKSGRFEIPAVAVDILDSTGAGDVLAAGFLGGLIKGWPIMKCGKLGGKDGLVKFSRLWKIKLSLEIIENDVV